MQPKQGKLPHTCKGICMRYSRTANSGPDEKAKGPVHTNAVLKLYPKVEVMQN